MSIPNTSSTSTTNNNPQFSFGSASGFIKSDSDSPINLFHPKVESKIPITCNKVRPLNIKELDLEDGEDDAGSRVRLGNRIEELYTVYHESIEALNKIIENNEVEIKSLTSINKQFENERQQLNQVNCRQARDIEALQKQVQQLQLERERVKVSPHSQFTSRDDYRPKQPSISINSNKNNFEEHAYDRVTHSPDGTIIYETGAKVAHNSNKPILVTDARALLLAKIEAREHQKTIGYTQPSDASSFEKWGSRGSVQELSSIPLYGSRQLPTKLYSDNMTTMDLIRAVMNYRRQYPERVDELSESQLEYLTPLELRSLLDRYARGERS